MEKEPEVVLKTENLKQVYNPGHKNEVQALRGVNFELARGDFVAMVGPSGSGKSTFMHLVGLLQTPTEGTIWLHGHNVSDIAKRRYPRLRAEEIGFVFQGFNLIPTLSAKENVMLAGRYAGLSARRARARAEELLREMGLGERMNHRPSELSGGQSQRVAIARALVNRPSLVLADEPTGELDSKTAAEIMAMLKRLNREGQTFLMVTHNLEVARLAEKVVTMRDGRIVK